MNSVSMEPGPLFNSSRAPRTFVVISTFWQLTSDHSQLPMDRIAALNEILTEHPTDAFARYGLAMEYSKQGDLDRALAEFSILLENNPDYTAGYFMAAQTLTRAERAADAKKMLQDGIAAARRTGNLHAQSEMEAMLAELTAS
ncbi:MAG: tetratricopeptide repeat protein [Candidatus Sulfotelmatobacter sp.]